MSTRQLNIVKLNGAHAAGRPADPTTRMLAGLVQLRTWLHASDKVVLKIIGMALVDRQP